MRPCVHYAAALLCIAALLAAGCVRNSDDVPTGPAISVPERIAAGWTYYRAGRFTEALDAFSEAASRDARSLEAYLGIGWASLQTGALDQARGNFNNVIALAQLPDLGLSPAMVETLTVEATVGRGSVALANEDFTSAWNDAREALSRMPTFRFRHDPSVDWRRVTLLEAEAAVGLNKFSLALAAVSRLDSTLYNDTTLLMRMTRLLPAQLQDSATVLYGRFQLSIPDPFLVMVNEVVDTTRLLGGAPVAAELDSIAEGGTTIYVALTPTPAANQLLRAKYLRTDRYADFLGRLRQLMNDLRQ